MSNESAAESLFRNEGVVFVLGGDGEAFSGLWATAGKKEEGGREGGMNGDGGVAREGVEKTEKMWV